MFPILPFIGGILQTAAGLLGGSSASQQAQYQAQLAAQQPKTNYVPWIIGGVGAVIFALFGIALLSRPSR